MTVLSANAFYYFNRTELQHKLILIEDLDGAESVLYPLRELQSKKRITKTVVHKDARGNTKTIHLTVEGPVSVAGCTTQESIYEDNSNRNFLLYIDESSEQDIRIMNYQRLISAGKINEDQEYKSREILKDVQRVLKPIKVINPFAEHLELPQSVFKPRRTNSHYLQFIEAITFYKQYQREQHVNEESGEVFIETTIEDIQEANELIQEVLLRKSDLLNGACRSFFEMLKAYLKANNQNTFTNAEIRRTLRINPSNQKRYMLQLQLAELVQRAKGDKRKGYVYEVMNYEDYETTNKQIETLLNTTLQRLEVQSSS
jgi:predicted transcriptional regulator